MIVTEATVRTAHASRYLVQLSKHWKHKIPELEYSDTLSQIPFPLGEIVLKADKDVLGIETKCATKDDALRLNQVIEDHIKRFAFRETLEFEWQHLDI